MAKTISTIQTLISNKISSLIDGGGIPLIKVVTNYGNGDFSGYPAAVIIPTGGQGKIEDTAVNERTFTFDVMLYQEQSQQATNKTDAATKMTIICDAIIEAFDIDPDLAREVMKVEVVDYSFDFKPQTGTWNFATFKINAVVLVQHY